MKGITNTFRRKPTEQTKTKLPVIERIKRDFKGSATTQRAHKGRSTRMWSLMEGSTIAHCCPKFGATSSGETSIPSKSFQKTRSAKRRRRGRGSLSLRGKVLGCSLYCRNRSNLAMSKYCEFKMILKCKYDDILTQIRKRSDARAARERRQKWFVEPQVEETKSRGPSSHVRITK